MAAFAGLAIGAALLLFAAPLLQASRMGPTPVAVWLITAAAAGGAALADGAATGWVPLDVALRAGLAAAVTLAAARTSPTATVWAASVASVLAVLVPSPLGVLAPAGLGLLIAQLAVGAQAPALQAAAAGLSLQCLLRLDWPLVTGASALAALVAVVPLLVAGHRTLPARSRRLVRRVALGVGVYCVLGIGVGLLAALGARDDIDRGLEAGVSGLDAIGGDAGASEAQLSTASAAFQTASDELGAFWVRPVYAVPFVAQQARAVRTMADAGADLSADALATLTVVDPATLSPRAGQIDLAAIASLADPLRRASATLRTSTDRLAEVGTPWLLPPLADSHERLTYEVVRASSTAEIAADAAEVLPAMLGSDGPRRYLLVVQTPSEARGSGGFMGNWGEITAVDGRLDLSRFGRVTELNDARPDPNAITLTGADEFIERYGIDVARTWGVNNFSPDFATVAQVMAQLYPQSGGQPVDGVISVDPYGLAALLDAVGKVRVEGWPDQISKDNVAQVLLHEQYVTFADDGGTGGGDGQKGDGQKGDGVKGSDDEEEEAPPVTEPVEEVPGANEERKDFLGDTAEAVFEKLVDGGFDSPASLANALAPAVEGRHLQIVSTHDDSAALFEALGATGAPPAVRSDSVGFVSQNYGGNKIDWFLTRHGSYDVAWDPSTGSVRGELTVELTNAAPATGLPESVIGYGGAFDGNQTPTADGENLLLLSLYSAFPLESLTLDGQPLAAARQREGGRDVYTAYVSLPAGATRTVAATTVGSVDPGDAYALDPIWQPMVNADQLDVTVRVPDEWRLARIDGLERRDQRAAAATWTLDQGQAATLEAERSGSSLLRLIRGEA